MSNKQAGNCVINQDQALQSQQQYKIDDKTNIFYFIRSKFDIECSNLVFCAFSSNKIEYPIKSSKIFIIDKKLDKKHNQ